MRLYPARVDPTEQAIGYIQGLYLRIIFSCFRNKVSLLQSKSSTREYPTVDSMNIFYIVVFGPSYNFLAIILGHNCARQRSEESAAYHSSDLIKILDGDHYLKGK